MDLQKKNLHYTSFNFQTKDIDGDPDSKFFMIEGLASTFTVDRGQDIVERGAFFSLKEHTPIILWQHDEKQPIGMPFEIEERDQGLFVKIGLPREDTLVKGRIIPQIDAGSIAKMSIGFTVPEGGESFEVRDGQKVRILRKIFLWEISLVTFPMNNGASITNFKSAIPFQDLPLLNDFNRDWNSADALKRVKEFTGSKETPSKSYNSAFLCKSYDENLSSYSLQIADVVDGKLMIIPKAIFSAAALLCGSRSNSDIPETDKEEIIKSLKSYYKKMGLKNPFDNSFLDTIEKFQSLKDISSFLKNYGLSNTETDLLNKKTREFKSRNDERIEALKILTNGLRNIKI